MAAIKAQAKPQPKAEKSKKSTSSIYYLSPHGEKGWKIMKQGGTRPSFIFDTKEEAMKKAREFGRENKATVIIKGKDGKIMDSLNYK